MQTAPQANARRRAQPLLGTLVRIEAEDAGESWFKTACDAAFAAIAHIHAVMSFHEPASDLRTLARLPSGQEVSIDPHTHAVLTLAMQMEARTQGAFNACCAPTLVERGRLPAPPDALPAQAASLTDGIALLDDHRVRVLRTPWIDLGGIAKGYAVDQAVQILQRHRVDKGIVDAGGDLRNFGPWTTVVHVRDPMRPKRLLPLAELTEMACATSARSLDQPATHIVGPMPSSRNPITNDVTSVSVFAAQCAIADALTKVVWLLGERAIPVLESFEAKAFVLYADGSSARW